MRTDEQIWKEDYLQPMFKKYESIPTKLKYMFIEKDYISMYGKGFAQDQIRYMYDDSETFIFAFENALYEFSKTVKKNVLKKYFEDLTYKEYFYLLKSGMFWEFFPNLSGEYSQDKGFFTSFVTERENNKKYVKLILQ